MQMRILIMFLISFPRVEVCASTATREAAGYETKKMLKKQH